MKTTLKASVTLIPVVCALVVLWTASAVGEELTTANTVGATEPAKTVSPSNQPPATALSPGIAEILKMADAGVSPDVILTYVEASPSGPHPTDKDIIALKEHKVSDEVVKLLLKRSATARVETAKAKSEAVLQIMESRRAATGGLDPESYDYFRAYHLQPRTVAFANQRLYSSGPYYPRAYGYGPVYTYGGVPGRYGHPAYRGYR
jgi:hypothetical protein